MLLLLRLVISTALVAGYYFPVPVAKKEAVRGVLQRLPAWINDHFDFEIEDNIGIVGDGARVYPENGKIFIQGGSGTTVLYAINHYLRNHCKTQITWDGNTYGDGCEDLIEEYYLEAPEVRYFGNQCTFSYSFAWWKWEDWEVFIDWLAMNGFNMALASGGQEALWRDLYIEMGVSRRDLDSYFTGPAYLAWHRMGNLKGYAGPVSDEFLDAQLELNKLIVERMASLGITPILPTFAGFVPDALVEMFPEKKSWEKQFIRNSCWDKFNSTYSCLASVKPLEDLFTEIGGRFLQKQREAYGTLYHVYSADPLNEIPQRLTDITYLKNLAWSVHSSCMSGDNKCLWVMQSWTFSYDNWPKQSVKAFLSGVEPGRLMMLDLYAEHYPLWSHLKAFYGHPYVWSMLHNFGGNTEMRGNIRHPNKHYQVAMTSGIPMVGGGLTMEGIHQNYVMYQFMIDRMWSKQMLDVEPWIENFVLSRYQTDNETIVNAWKLIVHTLYSQPLNKSESLVHGHRFEEFIFKRPQLSQSIKYWFPMEVLIDILNKFAFVHDSLSHNHLFRKDFNELRKVLLQYRLGNDFLMRVTEAIGLDDRVLLFKECQNVQRMFDTLDALSTYDYDEWEDAAVSWGSTPEEQKLFARNARLLVSLWGPNGENLDYAHRSWKGLIKKYYAPRWKFLCAWMSNIEHVKNQTQFANDVYKSVEKVFISFGRADVVPN